MNTYRHTAIAALAAAAFAAPLMAAAAPGERHRGGPVDFSAIDTDGDGALSRAELLERAATRAGTADADADGSLDRAEIIAVIPAGPGALADPFRASRAEALADRMLARLGATEAGSVEITVIAEEQVNRMLAAADADHDGAISEDESDQMARGRDRGPRHGHERGERARD